MAPSLIEVEAPASQTTAPIKAISRSEYKEAFITGPKAYNSEAETKGTAKQPAASHPSYLPVWDNEKEKWVLVSYVGERCRRRGALAEVDTVRQYDITTYALRYPV
jgi:hypothetical protein